MLRHIKLQPKTLTNPSSPSFLSLSSFSSSSSSSSSSTNDDPPPPHQSSSNPSPSSSSSSSPFSSYFTEIKQSLKSPPPPPRRIPPNPPPPSFPSPANSPPAASLEEIRRHLAEFRLKSSDPGSRDLPKKDIFGKPGATTDGIPFDSIRDSLTRFRSSPPSPGFNIKGFQDALRRPQLIGTDGLPDSIFGKERREKRGGGEEGAAKGVRTEFLKVYGYEELGEKLRGLRPARDGGEGEGFSLAELNERLGKLRELEERETESKTGGVSFRDLRESLQRLKDSEALKKATCECFLLLLLLLLCWLAFDVLGLRI